MEKIKKILINVLVLSLNKSLFFICDSSDYQINDFIVVETARGIELGKVVGLPIEKEILDTDEYPKVIKKGYTEDYEAYLYNIERAKDVAILTQDEANKLNLDMKIISADYTLDGSKVIISYLSEARVDFRDLLKILAASFKCRIELRQIGTRDKAKMIGGIGICGLKLCCSTFLNEFDGISITMAKNQMLALNIPKLSGHCGKLICCLKYENDAYLDLQKELPRIGTRVRYENDIYKITSMNVITKMIRIENKDNIATLPYEQIKDDLLPRDYPMNMIEPTEENSLENTMETPVINDEPKEETKPSFNNKNNFNNRNNNYRNNHHNNRPFNRNRNFNNQNKGTDNNNAKN